jgi:hypothetical protein
MLLVLVVLIVGGGGWALFTAAERTMEEARERTVPPVERQGSGGQL